MSESDAAVARGNNVEEDDCPLCLEPLPPFWDANRRSTQICCGKSLCADCREKRDAVVRRAMDEGSFGRQEEQLNSTCPLCRTKLPNVETIGIAMLEKYERDELPLSLYGNFGRRIVNGHGGLERDEERGNEILMLGAEKGDPQCQFLVGLAYLEGNGLQKSTTEAKRWFLAATEQGHAVAEYELAMTLRKEGNDTDHLRHLRGSASKGLDEACYTLGLVLAQGIHGAQKSLEEAILVVTPAAERGDADSMGLLGDILCSDPNLLPPNNPRFVEGVQLMRRAAAKGDENSVSLLEVIQRETSSACFMCYSKAPPEKAFLRCSRCRAAWYCSRNCQRRHWKASERGHKQYCIKWNEAEKA